MYETASRMGFNPRKLHPEAEVPYGEVEDALASMDERTDHERAVDATLQYLIDRYDERSYDLILTSVDYDLTDRMDIESDGLWKGIATRRYQGEFDVLLLDVDRGMAEGFEVKPHKGPVLDSEGDPIHEDITHERRARKQSRRKAFAFEYLNENMDGFDWEYFSAGPIYESELRPEHEVPDAFSGSYHWDNEARRKALESENFRKLNEAMIEDGNPEIFEPETALTREKRERGDFVAEFLEE